MTLRDELKEADSPSFPLPAIIEPASGLPIPAIIAAQGDKASERFFTYFTDTIRNKNTRAAYFRNACRFMAWCEDRGLTLPTIRSFHVSAYVEELGQTHEPPSVKQHLATIRMLFDWLIVGQIVELNPAQAVRGPKHVVKKGKTPVLNEDEARTLIESINGKDVVSLRDRGAHRGVPLLVRPDRGGSRDGCRGLLSPGETLVVSPAREGREAPRHARASQGRKVRGRLH